MRCTVTATRCPRRPMAPPHWPRCCGTGMRLSCSTSSCRSRAGWRCAARSGRGDDTPILMLTARDLVSDRVAGLDAGADDYLAKPFALEELRARLRALLRRSGAGADLLRFTDIELDVAAHQASRRGERLSLTKTEFALLELFVRNPGRVLSRTQIFESVWGYDFGPESNGLWVYISYLRRKMGEPRLIQTVRGIGYVLREET